jgi:4-carboxymuconolactone decarboxylase
MARIPYPDLDTLPPENRALLEKLPDINIFRMLAGSGACFPAFMDFLNSYMNQGVLDPELRELVILRVGHLCGSAYELYQHERVSRMIGMKEERISAAAGKMPSPLYSEAENAAIALTDNLFTQTKADAEILARARHHVGDTGLQQIILVIGFYMLVSRYLESLEIEIEEKPFEVNPLPEINAASKK